MPPSRVRLGRAAAVRHLSSGTVLCGNQSPFIFRYQSRGRCCTLSHLFRSDSEPEEERVRQRREFAPLAHRRLTLQSRVRCGGEI